jgi:hypothetical protein
VEAVSAPGRRSCGQQTVADESASEIDRISFSFGGEPDRETIRTDARGCPGVYGLSGRFRADVIDAPAITFRFIRPS